MNTAIIVTALVSAYFAGAWVLASLLGRFLGRRPPRPPGLT